MILVSHVITRQRDKRVLSLYEQEPIQLGYHPAKFDGKRHPGSGDIMLLVYHVILT